MESKLLYPFLLMFLVYSLCGNSMIVPRMSPFPNLETSLRDAPSFDKDNFKTFYYPQTLDHFNFFPQSSKNFSQRFIVNSKYWGGANSTAPIFAYLGGERSLDRMPQTIGFMTDNAPSFKALLVYIEHRYYGESIPHTSNDEEPYWDANNLGPLTSTQAIVDYAVIIMHIKEAFKAQMSPVIVIGGSYGGMLAAWFRLKFPHVAIGALASSAPILNFDGVTPQEAYFDVVTRDFRETSESCFETILKSWSEIDRLASQPNGLSFLSTKFNTCFPLTDSSELVDYLQSMYAHAAQYDWPPRYPVNVICNGINGAAFGTDILSRIYGGVVAYNGSGTCKVNNLETAPKAFDALAKFGAPDAWVWQTCTEMITPICTGNHSMFPPKPYDIEKVSEDCELRFGVSPRPHWVPTFYGGINLSLALQMFGSNIIFSNGLRDPYSSGGILKSLSNSLVAVKTTNGAHCLDLYGETRRDPKWLTHQRRREVKIIHGWLTEYYAKLNECSTLRLSYLLFFVVLFLGYFGPNFLF